MSRKALLESIEHWKRLADGGTEAIGASTCALCQVYHNDFCTGCPVMEKSGQDGCEGTPWEDVWRAYVKHGRGSPEFLTAAAAERDFLISLLEETE